MNGKYVILIPDGMADDPLEERSRLRTIFPGGRKPSGCLTSRTGPPVFSMAMKSTCGAKRQGKIRPTEYGSGDREPGP